MKNVFNILPIAAFFALVCIFSTQSFASTEATIDAKKAQEKTTPTKTVDVQADMSFGRIVRIQKNVATVQIISKIQTSKIEPKFLVCDVKLNPVAELESMHIGFRDCFLFKISHGNAKVGDTVIVRYYMLREPEKTD